MPSIVLDAWLKDEKHSSCPSKLMDYTAGGERGECNLIWSCWVKILMCGEGGGKPGLPCRTRSVRAASIVVFSADRATAFSVLHCSS